jgi:hypothetical protein
VFIIYHNKTTPAAIAPPVPTAPPPIATFCPVVSPDFLGLFSIILVFSLTGFNTLV